MKIMIIPITDKAKNNRLSISRFIFSQFSFTDSLQAVSCRSNLQANLATMPNLSIYKEFPLLSKKYLSVYFVDAGTDNFRFIG